MRILVMIIVKDGIWLPRLPPLCLECDARVIQDAMIENVQTDSVEHHCAMPMK